MISKEELQELIKDLESDRVEQTSSTKDKDKYCQAVCAFANDLPDHRRPGYLLVGVNKDGSLSGLKVTDELLKLLGTIRSDGNIQPLPAINVGKFEFEGGEVALVEVLPSDLPPVRYNGRIWIRVGPRRAIANEHEERILIEKRASSIKTFDARPCLGCDLDELDLDRFLTTYRHRAFTEDVIRANNRDPKEQLASLRFFDLGKDCATNAGALLFGKDPRQWMESAYVQFVAFGDPASVDNVIWDTRFEGDLISLLRDVDRFINLQVQGRPEFVSILRQETIYGYPPLALREFIMNAIMHRDYESSSFIRFYSFPDRIEIQSPGGLYPPATPENFPRDNAYRNPVIAEAMRTLGYVNRYGWGVRNAQSVLAKNGNAPAEFTFEPTHFLVTVRRAP